MIRRGREGFTLIELLIVIAIMGMLLVLGVVNLRSTQANARDSQRASDSQTIAASLEAFYPLGNSTVTAGEYPSTTLATSPTTYLVNINVNALDAPGQTSQSIVAATNTVGTTSGVLPQPTISTYVYQPITTTMTSTNNTTGDGNGNYLCDQDSEGCIRFYLYYKTELDNVVHQIVSRHQ